MLTNEKFWEEKHYLLGERIVMNLILTEHFGGRGGLSKELCQKSFNYRNPLRLAQVIHGFNVRH